MADIKLNNLTEISQVSQLTATKNLLIFDSTSNAGNRITLNTLAKSVIESQSIADLAGTSQTVKAAINTLNSNVINLNSKKGVLADQDLNDIKQEGVYLCTNTTTNKPTASDSWGQLIVTKSGSGETYQTFYLLSNDVSNANDEYVRNYSSNQWGAWVKRPTRAEITAINSKISTIDIIASDMTDLDSKITAEINALEDHREKTVSLMVAAGSGEIVRVGTFYEGIIGKNTNNYGVCLLYHHYGEWVFGNLNDGTLTWTKQPSRSEIETLNSKTSYETITDFNTFRPSYSGIAVLRRYGYCTSDGASNAPITGGNYTWRGYAEGTGSNTYCTQHFTIEYATNQMDCGRTFVRAYLNGTWTVWIEQARNGFGWLPNNTNIDDITQNGTYGLAAGNTYTTLPTGHTAGGVLEVFTPSQSGTYAMQRLSTDNVIFIRYRSSSSGTTWTTWSKLPTRSEIETLNSKQTLVSVSKYSTEGGIVLDTSPSTSRPFGILMIGYEGMTHFKVVADSVEKTGTIGTDPGYYDSETHSFKSTNSNREITIIAPSNMAILS